jgi:hypothetical protein
LFLIFFFLLFRARCRTSKWKNKNKKTREKMLPARRSAALVRQFLYFCTSSKASKEAAASQRSAALVRQFLYLCTSSKASKETAASQALSRPGASGASCI